MTRRPSLRPPPDRRQAMLQPDNPTLYRAGMSGRPLAEGPEELYSESIPPLRRTDRESGLSRIWDDPSGREAADCPICGTIPLPKGRGVIVGKHPPSTPDRSGIRIVPYMGRSPQPGSRGLSHMWDNPPCRRAEELCSESIPPLRRTVRESGSSRIWDDPPRPGSRGLSHMWDNPPCRRAGMFHMGGQSPSSRNRSVPQSGRRSATHRHLFHPEG